MEIKVRGEGQEGNSPIPRKMLAVRIIFFFQIHPTYKKRTRQTVLLERNMQKVQERRRGLLIIYRYNQVRGYWYNWIGTTMSGHFVELEVIHWLRLWFNGRRNATVYWREDGPATLGNGDKRSNKKLKKTQALKSKDFVKNTAVSVMKIVDHILQI